MSSYGNRFNLAAIAVVVGSSLAACGGGAAPAANTAAADEATATWVKAFNGGDAVAIAALYAEDAHSTPPSGGVNSGRSQIESYWREDIGSGGDMTTLTVNDSTAQGDLLHVDGAYEVASTDGAVTVGKGQYQQLWRRVDDQWKIQREIWRLDPLAQRDPMMAERLGGLWTSAYNAGDAVALTALYDKDAVLSARPNGSVTGAESIGAFWKEDFGASKPQTTLTLTDVYLAGDLAHLEGEYEVADRNTVTKGHYVQLWMQDGKTWSIHREMWWQ